MIQRRKLLPKPTKESRVFLPPELLAGLTDVAEFHTAAFKELGSIVGVSRNDIIEWFLADALDSYWAELGGRPASEKDRTEKLAKLVEDLKKEAEREAPKKGSK